MSSLCQPAVRAAAVVAAAVLAGAGALGADLSRPAYAENGSVSATGSNTFEPNRVAVLVGESVTWTTTGGVNHTVTSSSANWRKDDSIALVGRSTSFAFSKAGTYTYYCKTHGSPTAGMRGTVVVGAPSRPAPSPTRTTAAPKPTPKPSTSPSVTRSPTPRPTPSRTPAASASARPTPSATPSPAQTRSTAPIGFPTSVPAPVKTSAAPLPTVAESESPAETAELVDLGSGGLGPRASTGRGRGLPAFLALVALGGVVSAQIRALLNLPPS